MAAAWAQRKQSDRQCPGGQSTVTTLKESVQSRLPTGTRGGCQQACMQLQSPQCTTTRMPPCSWSVLKNGASPGSSLAHAPGGLPTMANSSNKTLNCSTAVEHNVEVVGPGDPCGRFPRCRAWPWRLSCGSNVSCAAAHMAFKAAKHTTCHSWCTHGRGPNRSHSAGGGIISHRCRRSTSTSPRRHSVAMIATTARAA